jgi:hypothetical protein
VNIKEVFNVGALTGANELPIVVSNSDCAEVEEIKSFEIGFINEETLEFYSEKQKKEYIEEYLDDGYGLAELEREFRKAVYLSPGVDSSYTSL